ncbi:hypothetical protein R0J90_19045, partial [Micrococcus sp. SIMBA_144]
MLMGLTEPIGPGEEVADELELEDGSTMEAVSVARPFGGANESYHGGEAEESDEHADHWPRRAPGRPPRGGRPPGVPPRGGRPPG